MKIAGASYPIGLDSGGNLVAQVTLPSTGFILNAGQHTVTVTDDTGRIGSANVTVLVTQGGGAASLTVNKVLVPAGDPGRFYLQVDGATAGTGADIGNGGTTGAVMVTVGSHSVSEAAGTGTNLASYTTVISGDCAANGSITLAAGESKVCTITNTRKSISTMTLAPSPIASAGTLAASATVNVTVTAKDVASNPIPSAQVYLKFVPATGGGSARVGTITLTGALTLFATNGSGQVTVVYTAPSTLPNGGTDALTAQNAASSPTVTATGAYAFAASSGSSTTISGNVTLQGRTGTFPNGVGHGIATVTLSPGNVTVQVGADGAFQITGVAAGTYTVTASAPGYLSAQKASLVVGGTPVTLADVQLHAGMVNSDAVVNIQDISATVASFGTMPAARVDAQGRFVDQNGDGFVNIQDISLVVSGFGQSSPQPWP